MALARRSDLGPVADEITRLRGQIDTMQRRRADTDVIPVASELSSLFPEGGLRPGSSYAVSASTSLMLALFSEPSATGSWCAALGMPELGAEAAESFGVSLDRLALIPYPGERWLSVAAALAEVVPVIAVRPPTQPRDAEISRLSARLRDRGSVLIVLGDWAGADVSVQVDSSRWQGLGDGYGLLSSREVTLSSASRRFPRRRQVQVLLPGPGGALAPCTSRSAMPGAAPMQPAALPALPAHISPATPHLPLPPSVRALNTVDAVGDELARRRRERDLAQAMS